MSAVAALRSLPKPVSGQVSPFRLFPKIVLVTCGYCVAGRVRYVANGRVVDQACSVCAGRGTVAVEV